MAQRVSPLIPLQYKVFRLLWSVNQITILGNIIQGVAAAWLMTSLTTSPGMIALVQASTSLPVLLFSLTAGTLADGMDRRKVMLFAQIFMLVVSIGLVAVAYLDMLTPWSLLAFTFMIGLGSAMTNPSWQASIGDLVPREHVPEAVSLNGMGANLMRSTGPAIGGIIVATFGPASAFAINTLSYLPYIAALLRWKPEVREKQLPREAFSLALMAGLRYVAMSPNLLRVLLRGLLFGFGAISIMALLPLITRSMLQGGPLQYGFLLGCFGLGAIAGGTVSAQLRSKLGEEWLVRAAFVGFAAACFILSESHSLWISLPAMALAGACWLSALSLFNVTVQLSSPRWVVGRALALYQMAVFGGFAIGSWFWGLNAEAFGLQVALIGSGICLLIGAGFGLRFPMPTFNNLDLSPLNQFKEPHLLLDLQGRSGPILIMIDYLIDAADIAEFLTVMTERRRIRRRDGARQWALLRDMEHPDQWTESYHVATWNDYLRHNMRRTKADAEVSDILLRLHRGAQPPLVHRMIERQSAHSHGDVPLKTIVSGI